jgi:hypothetical protein
MLVFYLSKYSKRRARLAEMNHWKSNKKISGNGLPGTEVIAIGSFVNTALVLPFPTLSTGIYTRSQKITRN